ncbi:MAG: 4Fe-4S binding protein [Thermodesulfobacteriota bacterium]
MTEKNVFQKLAEEIGAGESTIIPKIFSTLADEVDVRILLAASPPATVEEIAEKSGVAKERVGERIAPLFRKGLIFASQKGGISRYYRVRNVGQFHDSSAVSLDASRELLDLWKEYMAREWVGFGKKIDQILPRPVIRVIPVNVGVDQKTEILAFEDVRRIVESAQNLAVTKCSCRAIDGKCGKIVEVCFQINRAADYAVERGTGRKVDKEEAIRLLKLCEEEGLVHVISNSQEMGHFICNCCNDCCMNWILLRNGVKKFVVPSRFQAEIDAGSYSSCGTCLERCYFDAIRLEDTALVDPQKCMGCGLCMVTCPTEAIALREVRGSDFLPKAG